MKTARFSLVFPTFPTVFSLGLIIKLGSLRGTGKPQSPRVEGWIDLASCLFLRLDDSRTKSFFFLRKFAEFLIRFVTLNALVRDIT